MTAGDNETQNLYMWPLSFSEETPSKANSRVQLRSRSAIGCYLDGRLELSELLGFELFVFDPVVVSSAPTISVTILLSGSISSTRSGSFTNSSFFASGT